MRWILPLEGHWTYIFLEALVWLYFSQTFNPQTDCQAGPDVVCILSGKHCNTGGFCTILLRSFHLDVRHEGSAMRIALLLNARIPRGVVQAEVTLRQAAKRFNLFFLVPDTLTHILSPTI